jgi:hypothetical protein
MMRGLRMETGIFLLLLSSLIACQDTEIGMQIVNIRPFDVDNCQASDSDDVFLVSGMVDIALRDNYIVNPIVRNNLADVTKQKGLQASDARIATNGIVLKSAEIEYSPLDGIAGSIPGARVIPLSGTVSETSSLMLFNFPLIESEVMEALRSSDTFFLIDEGTARPKRTSVTLLTSIRIKGETLDGRPTESEPFLFPVEVCNGCMVTFPSELIEDRNGRLVCTTEQLTADETATASPPVCPNLVGIDGLSTNCLDCQGYAVNTFSRQLCQPVTLP